MCILCSAPIVTDDCPTAKAPVTYGIDFPAVLGASISEDPALDAPANTTTPYSMSVGDVFSGNLSSGSDRDWVAVDLTQGETYQINLNGVGGSGVSDTYLRIYDSNGNLIAFNDDSNGSLFSEVTLEATVSGTFFVSAGSYADGSSGDYAITVEEYVAPPITDAITWQNGNFTVSSIEVSFMLSGQTVDDEGNTITSDGFTAQQMADIEVFLDYLTDFTNLNISFSTNNTSADIRLATTNIGGTALGYMYPQNTSVSSDGLGVLTSDSTYWNAASTSIGGFMYGVIIHELGHGLGLAHPHDAGGGSSNLPGVNFSGDLGLNGNMNQSVYTIMSYNEGWQDHPLGGSPVQGSGYMASFGALDMAVLQSYYGSNTSYRTGNDTYNLGDDAYYVSLWDAGGIDTVQVTDNAGSYVNLQAASLEAEAGGAGNVSYTNSVIGGFTIANGVLIENANGAAGADEIVGNEAGNELRGFDGNDTLSGQDGNDLLIGANGVDTIFGGDGADTVFSGADGDKVYGGDGDDSIYANTGNDLLFGGDGDDLIVATGGDDLLNGGDGNDALYANDGEDIFFGGLGDDSFFGGKGQDTLYGGEGNDVMTAGNQEDYVYGNQGNDTMYGGTNDDYLFGGLDDDEIGGGGSNDVLEGGFGNDILRGGGGADSLSGGAGDDTLEGGVGDDSLDGGAGNDRIVAAGGDDTLDGGAGDDILIGSSGFDTFVFTDGFGNDVINDFAELNAFEDIDLSSVTNIGSYGDLVNNHMIQSGANVVITDGADTITVLNALLADMNASDFIF